MISEGIFAIKFKLHQIIVLSVVLLYVRCDFLGVRLLQRLNSLIVVLEGQQLLFELFAALFKLLLGILKVCLHILDLLLILLLEVSFLLCHGLLVYLKLALGLLFFF